MFDFRSMRCHRMMGGELWWIARWTRVLYEFLEVSRWSNQRFRFNEWISPATIDGRDPGPTLRHRWSRRTMDRNDRVDHWRGKNLDGCQASSPRTTEDTSPYRIIRLEFRFQHQANLSRPSTRIQDDRYHQGIHRTYQSEQTINARRSTTDISRQPFPCLWSEGLESRSKKKSTNSSTCQLKLLKIERRSHRCWLLWFFFSLSVQIRWSFQCSAHVDRFVAVYRHRVNQGSIDPSR